MKQYCRTRLIVSSLRKKSKRSSVVTGVTSKSGVCVRRRPQAPRSGPPGEWRPGLFGGWGRGRRRGGDLRLGAGSGGGPFITPSRQRRRVLTPRGEGLPWGWEPSRLPWWVPGLLHSTAMETGTSSVIVGRLHP